MTDEDSSRQQQQQSSRFLLSREQQQQQQRSTPRRHSINVASTVHTSSDLLQLRQKQQQQQPTTPSAVPHGGKRRQSIQESLQHITHSLQRAIHLGGSNSSLQQHEEGKSRLTKAFFREVLSAHFRQPDLKVTKLQLRGVPNPHTNQVLHEVEVWVKDTRGRRKLDLLAKYQSSSQLQQQQKSEGDWVLDGTNDEMERERMAYETVLTDMWDYLRTEKGVAEPQQYLCLPMRYKSKGCDGGGGDGILVLQDLFSCGYRSAPQERMDETGLDFNHSIMALTRLARFHSVSYSMRKERDLEMRRTYPFLQTDPVYRPDTASLFSRPQSNMCTRLMSIFQHSPADLRSFSTLFLEQVKRLHSEQSRVVAEDSKDFGVLCHGDLWRQNVLFFYGSSLECQTDCLDARFEDLHRVRFASCVTDLLYFLFTTVDAEVRRDHMMDLVAVYHDHFSKTVSKLAPEVSMFSREQLFAEFRSHLMFGFLEGLCLFSSVYESQLRKTDLGCCGRKSPLSLAATAAEVEAAEQDAVSNGKGNSSSSSRPPRYADYKDAVVAMVSDVVRLQLQG